MNNEDQMRAYNEYSEEARKKYGDTKEFREFDERIKSRTAEQNHDLVIQMMDYFKKFGAMQDQSEACEEAQLLVEQFRQFISANFYECSKEVLYNLGKVYREDENYTKTINNAAGEGAAEFASKAIMYYCR